MSAAEEKPAKIEPRWHKRDTLTKLREKRVEISKARAALETAKNQLNALGDEARVLEREACEWMERDQTRTEVVLYPDPRQLGERQVAIVFTRNDYGTISDTAVEPV